MLNRDIIELVSETSTTKNAIGNPIINRTYSQVFADKLPVYSTEHYQANAQGLKPAFKFKIREIEYSDQQQIRYPVTTGKLYDIIRIYPDGEFIELTLQGVVLNANA